MATTRQSSTRSTSKDRANKNRSNKYKSRRTTVILSDEASDVIERFKAATGASTSRAIDELILRTEPQKSYLVEKDGFLLLDLPLKNGKITTEDVKRMLEDVR